MIYNEKLTKLTFYAFPLPKVLIVFVVMLLPLIWRKNADKSCGCIAIAEAMAAANLSLKRCPPPPGHTSRHFLVFSTVLIWETKFMQDNIDIK